MRLLFINFKLRKKNFIGNDGHCQYVPKTEDNGNNWAHEDDDSFMKTRAQHKNNWIIFQNRIKKRAADALNCDVYKMFASWQLNVTNNEMKLAARQFWSQSPLSNRIPTLLFRLALVHSKLNFAYWNFTRSVSVLIDKWFRLTRKCKICFEFSVFFYFAEIINERK